MKTLLKALSLCALIAAQPALAQTLEGDKNVEVSFNVIGGDTQSSFRVLEQPNFGQLVRPRLSEEFEEAFCTYFLDNTGETSAQGFADPKLGLGLAAVDDIECAFLSSAVPQKLEIECPLGQSVFVNGSVERDGILARIRKKNVDGDVCTTEAFEPSTVIEVSVFPDAVLGVSQLTIPVDITLSD